MPMFDVPDDIKGLRETLCRAQAYIMHDMSVDTYLPHAHRIQMLIDQCDKHRPLGPNGKHGDRHTATCGCENKGSYKPPAIVSYEDRSATGKYPFMPPKDW